MILTKRRLELPEHFNLIAGDGETNVLELNTLEYERWDEHTTDINWRDTYNEGFKRLERLRVDKNDNRRFKFDLLMANPPFAGSIQEVHILELYSLATKENGDIRNKVGREILFIERNLDFLKPGGRMAIVLPQGKLGAPTYQYIREFVAEHARILAVISLHEHTFKPHTDTKTGVLFLQKWNNDENAPDYCPEEHDYPIFFASSTESGKDTSGNYNYLKDDNGINVLDNNRHTIVKHDLHNHDRYLDKGIAESFIAWAKKVDLSFADPSAEEWQPLPNTYEKKLFRSRKCETYRRLLLSS